MRGWLRVAITQSEAILAKAKATEANNIAKKQAEEARTVASELKDLGTAMDSALDALITKYGEIQAASIHLDQLGFGFGFPRNTLNIAVLTHLAISLQRAGFSISNSKLR